MWDALKIRDDLSSDDLRALARQEGNRRTAMRMLAIAHALRIPDNIMLVPLPPYSRELNPVERVWLHLRERYLSHRLLDDYEAIADACCTAWNALTSDRDTLRSLTALPWLQKVIS